MQHCTTSFLSFAQINFPYQIRQQNVWTLKFESKTKILKMTPMTLTPISSQVSKRQWCRSLVRADVRQTDKWAINTIISTWKSMKLSVSFSCFHAALAYCWHIKRKANISQIERNEVHKYSQLDTKWRITVLLAACLPNANGAPKSMWKYTERKRINENERKVWPIRRENIGQIMFVFDLARSQLKTNNI